MLTSNHNTKPHDHSLGLSLDDGDDKSVQKQSLQKHLDNIAIIMMDASNKEGLSFKCESQNNTQNHANHSPHLTLAPNEIYLTLVLQVTLFSLQHQLKIPKGYVLQQHHLTDGEKST